MVSRLMVLVLGVLFASSCSKDTKNPDAAVADASITSPDGKLKPDIKLAPDVATTKVPKILKILPDNGPSDGGTKGQIPVTLIGENFSAGAVIYIDGGTGGIINANVASAASLSFVMPKNPYGPPYDNPIKVKVAVRMGNHTSNSVDFQYTIVKDPSAENKGVLVTKSSASFRDFPSDPFEARVLVKGHTDTTTGSAPASLKVQIGIGKVGDNPAVDTGFNWADAVWAKDDGATGYDVYRAELTAPLAQTYDVALRFSVDGGQSWTYADTNEADLKYAPADAGKLTATAPPFNYCTKSEHCATRRLEKVCLIAADKTKNQCVECLATKDCADNPDSFGPKCETTKYLCYCDQPADCATNKNGLACMTQKYCGCGADKDCPAATPKCAQDPSTKLQTCIVK